MILNLLNASIIAAAAHSIAPTMRTVIAMSTIQSRSPEIERAATQQAYLFAGYVFLLLLTLVGTVLLYRAGNKYQEAVKKDADARIAEAGDGAAKANAEAAKANERTAQLSIQLEEANAKADIERQKVAKLEIEAATARLRQAEAERALLQLQERVRSRTLSGQHEQFVEILRAGAKGRARVECPVGSAEACNFANEVIRSLNATGWIVQVLGGPFRIADSSVVPAGITIVAHSRGQAAPHVQALYDAFTAVGFQVAGRYDADVPEDGVRVMIGVKP